MPHACPLTPDRELTTEQSMDTTRVQLGETMSYIGVTHRSTKDSKTTASPKLTPACTPVHNHQEHTAQPAGALQQLWPKPLPGSSLLAASSSHPPALFPLYCFHFGVFSSDSKRVDTCWNRSPLPQHTRQWSLKSAVSRNFTPLAHVVHTLNTMAMGKEIKKKKTAY